MPIGPPLEPTPLRDSVPEDPAHQKESKHPTEQGGRPGAGRLPLATFSDRRDVFERLLDADFMLPVFQRELSGASAAPIRVLGCSIKPAKTVSSRKNIREQRMRLVYRLDLELEPGTRRELVVCGVAPVAADFPGPELEQRCENLRDHPLAAPFRRLALRVTNLELGLLLFPVDPGLPALAEVTGTEAARLFAPHLPECQAGARIERIECELRHYKPGERAVLRVRATLLSATNVTQRTVYAKLFADQQGAVCHAELRALSAAARRSDWLRIPEPLGYDPERRMLVMAEVPGGRDLAQWIHCIENEQPLPPGVDLQRLEHCLLTAARALSTLQRSGVEPSARRTFHDALAPLRKDCALLRGDANAPHSPLVARALALVQRLESLAPLEEYLVPSHGGCKHKQTIGDERGLAFVDWDGFCLADPALDAATFLARLRQEPVTTGRGMELERLAESFRRVFCTLSPEAARHLALYEALTLTEQMLRSFRRTSRDGAMAGTIERLASAAEQRLAGC